MKVCDVECGTSLVLNRPETKSRMSKKSGCTIVHGKQQSLHSVVFVVPHVRIIRCNAHLTIFHQLGI
jgi:hypothetical protein